MMQINRIYIDPQMVFEEGVTWTTVPGLYPVAYVPAEALTDAHATIARLTTELEAALKEQDRLAKAWEAKHAYQVKQSKGHDEYFDKSQRRMHELVAERDQARAGEVAAYERAAKEARPVGLRGGNDYSTQFHQCADRIRALVTEPGTTALAEMLDAETRACAEVAAKEAEEWRMAIEGSSEQDVANECHNAILARIAQRKEAV